MFGAKKLDKNVHGILTTQCHPDESRDPPKHCLGGSLYDAGLQLSPENTELLTTRKPL